MELLGPRGVNPNALGWSVLVKSLGGDRGQGWKLLILSIGTFKSTEKQPHFSVIPREISMLPTAL